MGRSRRAAALHARGVGSPPPRFNGESRRADGDPSAAARASGGAIRDRALLVTVLVMCGVFLAWLPHLPFQDTPQHVKVLELSVALVDNAHEYLAKPDRLVFSYSLYTWPYRLLAPWVSPRAYLRGLLIVVALGIPLSILAVSRSVGAREAWSGILSAPLVFSWSLKMAFVPYLAGIPFIFFALAAAARACVKPSVGNHVALSVCLLLSYLAHALTYALAGLATGVVWLVLARGRWRLAGTLMLAIVPTTAPVAYDLAMDTFSLVPGVEQTLKPVRMEFRDLDVALEHVVTRTYGIADSGELPYYLPLLGVLLFGAIGSARSGQWHATARLIPWAAGLSLAGAVFAFESWRYLFYLGSRLGILFVGLLACAAGPFWARQSALGRAVATAAVGAALTINFVTLSRSADVVTAVSGPHGPRRVAGEFLSARVDACQPLEQIWGTYDPIRHLVLDALAVQGATPYLFAWNQYHPVQYRGERYAAELRAPSEHINSNDPLGTSCEEANRMRLWSVSQWASAYGNRSFDGAFVFGSPTVVAAALDAMDGWARARRLGPGIAVLRTPREESPPREVVVRTGTYGAERVLRKGWSFLEFRFDRWLRWAETRESEIVFAIDPSPGEYVLMLHLAPHDYAMPQRVQPFLNGEPVGEPVDLQRGWSVVTVRFPGGLLRREGNELRLAHARDTIDRTYTLRRLSVLYSSIQIFPAPSTHSLEVERRIRLRREGRLRLPPRRAGE